MNRIRTRIFRSPFVALAALAAIAGCGLHNTPLVAPGELLHYRNVALEIETPTLKPCPDDPALATLSPETIREDGPVHYWDMKLSEAMHTALARSKVMHDLGGAELRSPQEVRTISDPAIADTDPRYGVESALADYDAVFNASVDSQHNHRALNNIFFGGGTRILVQDLDTFKEEIVKETPTGTEFTFRHNTTYDNNNEPGNLFPSSWDTNFEAEVRQHLLQGGGLEYNRIAGPHGAPGQMNGVLIARINTDVALTDFEMGIRDLASNVENAYWDLYFAYRDLDAKVLARDNALESWRRTHALNLAGRTGGEAQKEALARQQYFQFQEEVENAWNGRLVDGTHTDNGSGGGTFRAAGVRVAERRLRRLLGLPISDGRLIRPSDEPALAKMIFAWDEILPEALTRRPELRRERWMVKRRELELIASRNFLLPTLDVTGLYRFRGFGHDLINSDPNQAEFASAYGDLGTGMFQEWELGAQYSMPIGERKGHTAVRNAQLMLARERAVLDDQEQLVVHDLSNAIAEVDRAYVVAQTAFNRRVASLAEVGATKAAFEADKVPLDLFLESQRRQADAESGFFGALVEYALAIKNLHYAKGSLLDYNEIYLSESPWPDKAYADAAKVKVRTHELLDYRMKPAPVSAGPIPQPSGEQPMFAGPGETIEGVPPGAVVNPVPPGNAPSTMLPPSSAAPMRPTPMGPTPMDQPRQGPTAAPMSAPPANLRPTNIPPILPPPVAPPQAAPSRFSPPETLPPSTGPDFSDPTTQQRPDLHPRNERLLSPTVQPAMSPPLSMDKLLARQSPPAAPAPIAPEHLGPATAVAIPFAPLVGSPTSAPSKDVAPPQAASPNDKPISAATAKPDEVNTLSIYSRSSTRQRASAPPQGEASQLRLITNSEFAPSPTATAQSNHSASSAAPSQSELVIRSSTTESRPAGQASWPESSIRRRPPIDGNDGVSPLPPTTSEGSIWARGAAVRPVSYPAALPSPSAACAAQSQLQPLPPTPAAQRSPQSSTLEVVRPLPPMNAPVAQPNSIEPLPPFSR
jgi:outer membrane protein TolC